MGRTRILYFGSSTKYSPYQQSTADCYLSTMQERKKGVFGERWVESVISKRGWVLGDFSWDTDEFFVTGKVVKARLTALLDVPPEDPKQLSRWNGLAQVHPYSNSYEIAFIGPVVGGFTSLSEIRFKDWPGLAQAVKRLAGVSN